MLHADHPADHTLVNYSWRVRLTRGPGHSIYWRTIPKKMTEADASLWAAEHHAVLRRVLGSGESVAADDLSRETPDQLGIQANRQPPRIDVDSAWELRQWCIKFRCSEKQLKDSIERVGPVAHEVERDLEQRATLA